MKLIKLIIKKLLSFIVIYKMPDDFIYLTFDDGPHPTITEKILNILKKEQIKATFFVVGNQAEKYPHIIQKIIKNGHSLGYHTKNHQKLNEIPLSALKKEIEYMRNGFLSKIAHKNITIFRPPHGDLSISSLIFFYFNRIKVIQWSIDSEDSLTADTKHIVQNVIKFPFKGGEIILFHDDEEHTPESLIQIVGQLKIKHKFHPIKMC